MATSAENCLVCRKKTYGALFCSLKHNDFYNKNKSKFSRKKLIKEIKEERRDELKGIKQEIKDYKESLLKPKRVRKPKTKVSYLDSEFPPYRHPLRFL